MSLITIKVEKIILHQENSEKLDEIISLLKELNDSETKKAIIDKLDLSIEDIKQTI